MWHLLSYGEKAVTPLAALLGWLMARQVAGTLYHANLNRWVAAALAFTLLVFGTFLVTRYLARPVATWVDRARERHWPFFYLYRDQPTGFMFFRLWGLGLAISKGLNTLLDAEQYRRVHRWYIKLLTP